MFCFTTTTISFYSQRVIVKNLRYSPAGEVSRSKKGRKVSLTVILEALLLFANIVFMFGKWHAAAALCNFKIFEDDLS